MAKSLHTNDIIWLLFFVHLVGVCGVVQCGMAWFVCAIVCLCFCVGSE